MKFIFFLLIMSCSTLTNAKVEHVFTEKKSLIKNIKILFLGEINDYKIADLTAVIDQINIQLPQAKKIYLFINSQGGSFSAGMTGYYTIKNSTIPITTINDLESHSSASFLYCAAKERLAYNPAFFILHPPTISKNSSFNLNTINNIHKNFKLSIQAATDIYHSCTNLTNKHIASLFYSEKNRLTLSASEAKKIKLVTRIINHSPEYQATYIVSDNTKTQPN